MKTSFKLVTGLVLAAATSVVAATSAMAGEGGTSGSIAINFQSVTTGALQGQIVGSVANPLIINPITFAVTPYTGTKALGQFDNVPGTGTTTNKVRSLSSSISIGKNGGASAARADGTNTFTSAIGGGGTLDVTNANQASAGYSLGAEDLDGLGTDQVNTFGGTTSRITVAPDANGNDTVTVLP